jgi:Uma2 family endonuclease
MNPTTTPETAPLDPRHRRIEELVQRHRASQCEDVEALIELTELLPDSDGVPLESPWHRAEISLLIESLTHYWPDRDDFFVGGNMFVYYSLRKLLNQDFRGPDFFYVSGVPRKKPRTKWATWEEDGHFPDLIVELLSPSTADVDRTVKKELYGRIFRTGEYFCYDHDSGELEGWRLAGSEYRAIAADERGWMWSETLKLWLGRWQGPYADLDDVWLRFFDAEGTLVPLSAESEHRRAEAERQRAEAERQRAEAERQRADAAEERAEAERRRVDGLTQEMDHLKAWLAELERRLPPEG